MAHAYSTHPERDLKPGVELSVTDTEAPDGAHRATVTVTDRGRWRPRLVSPDAPCRGLDMMRALTESVEVTLTGTGTRVEMISRAVPCPRHP